MYLFSFFLIVIADTDFCGANNGGCHPDAQCLNQIGKPPICKCQNGFPYASYGCSERMNSIHKIIS